METYQLESPARFSTNSFLRSSLRRLFSNGNINILDVGCGSGSYAQLIESLGMDFSYLGIDIKESSAWKQSRFPFKVFNAEDLIHLGQKFNVIISIQSLEHIANDKKAVAGMEACLEDNGSILISVPSKYSLLLYLFHGYRRYSIKNIKSLAHENKLKLLKISAVGGLMSFTLHLFLWTIPTVILSTRIFEFYKRHKLILRLILWLEKISISIDKVLRLLPSAYVAILSKSKLG